MVTSVAGSDLILVFTFPDKLISLSSLHLELWTIGPNDWALSKMWWGFDESPLAATTYQ